MTNITFVHRGGPDMASYRYRCQIPGDELEKKGFTVAYNGGDAHVCVFSKPVMDDLTVAKVAKAHGCTIIVDLCDDHFHTTEYGPIYGKMLQIADYIVCPTENMRNRMTEFTEKDITVIPDPYEMEELPPHANGSDLVWYGHQTNYQDIAPYKALEKLKIITGPAILEGTTHWSPVNVHRALREANICLLPTRKGVEYKSPNRLVNALRMGLFPVCDAHPAYEEFKEFIWSSGVYTGINWAQEFRPELNMLVGQGQEYIKKFSPERVGGLWEDLINSI